MTTPRRRQILFGIGWFLAALFAARLAIAGDYDRVVAFGDSLSDPGNAFVLTLNVSLPPFQLIPDAPYARGGMHFSNGGTWVERLAGELDARRSAGPALRKPLVFSNYAVGGARARPEGPFDLGTQVDLFLQDFSGSAPGDALYVVYAGSNDVRDALSELSIDPSADVSAIIQGALLATQDNILRLRAAGAVHFLVPNVPDLSLVPAVQMQGTAAQQAARALAAGFNAGLAQIVAGLELTGGLSITTLDVFALLDQVVAAPGSFGLSNVTQPCIVPGTTVHPYCSSPDRYLFWDGIHPTRVGHEIIAERAAAALGIQPLAVPAVATSP